MIVYPPAYFQMLKLNLRTETKALAINTKEKTVNVQTAGGPVETLAYDALVIATGADSFMPPIKGREKPGILSLRDIEDGERLMLLLRQALNLL